MVKNKISLRSLYEIAKRQATPGQMFIDRVSKVTQRSPSTVRMWLSGQQYPDSLARQAIANEFNVSADGLFETNITESKNIDISDEERK
jgi:transcriptional regulator with XRE-family HTH domain